jgi:hypothetical protein
VSRVFQLLLQQTQKIVVVLFLANNIALEMSQANCRIKIKLNSNQNAIYSPGQTVSGIY